MRSDLSSPAKKKKFMKSLTQHATILPSFLNQNGGLRFVSMTDGSPLALSIGVGEDCLTTGSPRKGVGVVGAGVVATIGAGVVTIGAGGATSG